MDNNSKNQKEKEHDLVKAINAQIDGLNNKFKIYDKVINSDSNKGKKFYIQNKINKNKQFYLIINYHFVKIQISQKALRI